MSSIFGNNETAEARARLERGLRALARREEVSEAEARRLLDASFADALMELMALVLERNETVNLTAITEPVEFVELQILDSLAPVGAVFSKHHGGQTDACSDSNQSEGRNTCSARWSSSREILRAQSPANPKLALRAQTVGFADGDFAENFYAPAEARSASVAPHAVESCDNEPQRVVDVGTGAGFPGLPLALLYPEKRFLLMDSLQKRIDFIEYAAEKLALRGVRAVHARAETAGHDAALRERFDLAVCRAVGALPVILEYCLPFVRVGGALIAYKTVRASGEIEDSLLAREMLGAAADMEIISYQDLLPDRAHALYVVRKERATPEKYPRREGIPSKVPL
ncbi:MAG: 16S rRNA (guanine(527)-N(7))-methyltransferase RsmG [Clostridiales Family XIII bacterium]|nr:16S rRNA (guanine(527)-N(7))-methyltransferase RsmG [Clostridiales Family XIII bacterium]